MEFVPPSPEEEEAVTALENRLLAENMSHTMSRVAILRFLRGRKGDPEKAFRAIEKHLQWRQEHSVDSIDEEHIRKELESRKVVVRGSDRRGRPLVTIYARRHRKDDRDLEQIRKFIIYSLERAIVTSNPDEQKMTILFDLAGFGMYCMDYDAVKIIIDVMQYNYPETLSVAMIVNAPWMFTACWYCIKAWLDPVTVAKVIFINQHQLQDYIHNDHVPEDLGV